MEKKMETTIVYRGLYWDNGKENGNYYIIWGFILGSWKRKWKLLYYMGVYIGIMEKKMETTIL